MGVDWVVLRLPAEVVYESGERQCREVALHASVTSALKQGLYEKRVEPSDTVWQSEWDLDNPETLPDGYLFPSEQHQSSDSPVESVIV